MELGEQFFRAESGRLVAALTRVFGARNLPLAARVKDDVMRRARVTWTAHGIPDDPSAWLARAAKARALDILSAERSGEVLDPQTGPMLDEDTLIGPVVESAFNADILLEEQLRMLFSCSDPALADESQIALILHLLCGFEASEIASARLTGSPRIDGAIAHGKGLLAQSGTMFELESEAFTRRLAAVCRALYRLFIEAYDGPAEARAVRADMCGEGVRLTELLLEYPPARTPATHALAALMLLQSAMLPARLDAAGYLNSLIEPDRASWDYRLVAEGLAMFERSAAGPDVTAYHVEAAIAAAHASARSAAETDWRGIVDLYDVLTGIAPSPAVALNRAIAVAQCDGPERGLADLRAAADTAGLETNPFYEVVVGELEARRGNEPAAREHFAAALALARTADERRFIETRLRAVGG